MIFLVPVSMRVRAGRIRKRLPEVSFTLESSFPDGPTQSFPNEI